jgi:hypothetical protein
MDKPNKIWRTGSKNIAGYKKLGQNYRAKNGSLLGFLEKYGVLITDEKKPYKLRVDGDRIKLANLQRYNAYQTLRQSLSGYKKIEKELLDLGISKEEVNAFIQNDKQKYKQIQSEVKAADAISSEAVEKGHIGSLKSGYPDVSSNIEPQLKRINAAQKSKSPFSGALLAEGVPRTSHEAFIRWKDSSGLPNPSDYTYEQRQLLRQAENVDEVDDLITSFEKGSARLNRKQLTMLAAAGVSTYSALGTAASAAETVGRTQMAQESGNPLDYVQAGVSGVSLAGDVVGAFPPAGPVGEVVSTVADVANIGIDTARDPKPLINVYNKIKEDPLNELKYAGKQVMGGLKKVAGAIIFGF